MYTTKRRSAGQHSQQGGFSMVELMAVIALISVLIGLAGPSFTGAIDRSKIRSATADVMASLSGARAKALTQNTQIMARSFANNVAWQTASGTTHPNGGWCVMKVNVATPQTACTHTTTFPMYESHEIDKGVKVTSTATSLIFKGDGTLNSAQVTFTVCKKGQLGNVITVGVAGRITTDPTAAKCL